MKKEYSRPGLFGTINHYDERGKKIGHSVPDLFGGYNHYDESGRKTGYSSPGPLGSENHYKERGRRRRGRFDLLGSLKHKRKNG